MAILDRHRRSQRFRPHAERASRVGDPAPRLHSPYATRDSISTQPLTLSKLFGKAPIVLAFYPAGLERRMHQEVCTLREIFPPQGASRPGARPERRLRVLARLSGPSITTCRSALVSSITSTRSRAVRQLQRGERTDLRTVYVIDNGGKLSPTSTSRTARATRIVVREAAGCPEEALKQEDPCSCVPQPTIPRWRR